MLSCAQRFCVDCAVNAKPYVERRAAMDKNLLDHLIKEKELYTVKIQLLIRQSIILLKNIYLKEC